MGQPIRANAKFVGLVRRTVWLDGNATVFRTMLAAGATTNDASSTNVQVAGVDEADLVETDGEYLYIISGKDLVIVKAGVGDELQIASRVRLDGEVTGMYLDGDRLALISTESGSGYGFGGLITSPLIMIDVLHIVDGDAVRSDEAPQEALQWHKPTTTITLLDVTDRSSPALVRKTELDGRLIASRAVDGQLRLVVANDFYLPEPVYHRVGGQPDPSSITVTPIDNLHLSSEFAIDRAYIPYYPWQSEEYVYESRQEYIDRVVDALLDDLPGVRELTVDGEVVAESHLVSPEGIYRPEANDIGSLTTVATIDMHGSGKVVDAASVMASQAATVYATQSDLYLMAQSSQLWTGAMVGDLSYYGPRTNIWKFGFDAQSHDVRLAARGKVDGTILNQFAADEHEGYLRVVTSGGSGWSQQLFVLQQTGKRLSVVGQIDDIAPGESLHSVRFIGDRAFAVTFRTIDPLFAIDLSDPTNPVIAGELHIPGYSDYLQPLDATHLIGIGRNADTVTGFFQELQISIFDVADLSDPQLVSRYAFDGGRSTATAATGGRWMVGVGDHHAVSYFASEQILAVPIYSDQDWSWWGDV